MFESKPSYDYSYDATYMYVYEYSEDDNEMLAKNTRLARSRGDGVEVGGEPRIVSVSPASSPQRKQSSPQRNASSSRKKRSPDRKGKEEEEEEEGTVVASVPGKQVTQTTTTQIVTTPVSKGTGGVGTATMTKTMTKTKTKTKTRTRSRSQKAGRGGGGGGVWNVNVALAGVLGGDPDEEVWMELFGGGEEGVGGGACGRALRVAQGLVGMWILTHFVLWVLMVSLFREWHWAQVSLLINVLHGCVVLGILLGAATKWALLRVAGVSFLGMVGLKIVVGLLLCFTVNTRIDDYCREEGTLLCGPTSPGAPSTPSRAELRAVFILSTFVMMGTQVFALVLMGKRVINYAVLADAADRATPAEPGADHPPPAPRGVMIPGVWKGVAALSSALSWSSPNGMSSDVCLTLTWSLCCCLFGLAIIGTVVLISLFGDLAGLLVYAAVDSI